MENSSLKSKEIMVIKREKREERMRERKRSQRERERERERGERFRLQKLSSSSVMD